MNFSLLIIEEGHCLASYGAVTSETPNKQSFISHMKSDVSHSIFLHPHVKRVASKVIMEEKAGGFCGIFLRAIHHFCPHLIVTACVARANGTREGRRSLNKETETEVRFESKTKGLSLRKTEPRIGSMQGFY